MYPHLDYAIARACAIAGYTELYRSLNVLPELHILCEAQEAGSKAIEDQILPYETLYDAFSDECSFLCDPRPTKYIRGLVATKEGMEDLYRDKRQYYRVY